MAEHWKLKTTHDRHEVNILIVALRAWGVSYLMGDSQVDEEETKIAPVQLIQRLATCGFPLVEDATISLFILHPELAPAVEEALESSEPETAENITVLTLATLYMQQWWLFRLAFALGRLPSFPEALFTKLWEERHLPAPSAGFGRDGLLALQEYQRQQYDLPLNFLHDWQNQINHLLAQEAPHQRHLSDDIIRTLKQISLANIA